MRRQLCGAAVGIPHHGALRQQMSGDGHAQAPGHMVIATAGHAQCRVTRAHGHQSGRGRRRQLHQSLQQLGHLGRCQAVVTVAPLGLHLQQPGLHHQGQVAAGRGGLNAASLCQLPRGQGTPIHQRQQHGSACRLAHQGRHMGPASRATPLHRQA